MGSTVREGLVQFSALDPHSLLALRQLTSLAAETGTDLRRENRFFCFSLFLFPSSLDTTAFSSETISLSGHFFHSVLKQPKFLCFLFCYGSLQPFFFFLFERGSLTSVLGCNALIHPLEVLFFPCGQKPSNNPFPVFPRLSYNDGF